MKVLGPDCSPKVPSKDPQRSGCSNSQLSCHFLMPQTFWHPPLPNQALPFLNWLLYCVLPDSGIWPVALHRCLGKDGQALSIMWITGAVSLSDPGVVEVVSNRKLCRGLSTRHSHLRALEQPWPLSDIELSRYESGKKSLSPGSVSVPQFPFHLCVCVLTGLQHLKAKGEAFSVNSCAFPAPGLAGLISLLGALTCLICRGGDWRVRLEIYSSHRFSPSNPYPLPLFPFQQWL